MARRIDAIVSQFLYLKMSAGGVITVYTIMNSGIVLARANDRPAYQQIIDQVKQRIASGDWKPGKELPSIRGLAAEVRVSVITVRRAYLELEREKIITTRQGLGSFVSKEVSNLDLRLQKQELQQSLQRAIELARLLGLSAQELRKTLDRIWKAEGKKSA